MSDTTWGSWSLGYNGTVLCHDGGYGIELGEFLPDPTWWAEHIRGKGWGTPDVIRDLFSAHFDLAKP